MNNLPEHYQLEKAIKKLARTAVKNKSHTDINIMRKIIGSESLEEVNALDKVKLSPDKANY